MEAVSEWTKLSCLKRYQSGLGAPQNSYAWSTCEARFRCGVCGGRQDGGRTLWASGSLKLRIAFSVLPVVLIVGWFNLMAGAGGISDLLLGNAIWGVVTLIAVGICVLLGRTAGASNATPLWIVGLLTSLLLAGFCLLTILSIGMLIFPLPMVLLTFSLVNLAAGFRLWYGRK